MSEIAPVDGMPKYRLAVALASAATIGICLMVLVQPNQTFFSLKGTQQLNVKKSSSTKPNFVFIYADDLAWNSIGYEDYDLQFTTPHLTSMAEKGIRMTNYYAQEVCNPSRASLLTGRYPASVGMQYGVIQYYDPWGLSLDETLLPEILKDEGYKTYMLGKWHLGHYSERMLPTARGFDTFTGYVDGQNYYYSKIDPTVLNGTLTDFMTSDSDCYYAYEGPDLYNYSTSFYRDAAIKTIYEHDQSDPMFMYLAFQAVHVPFEESDGSELDLSVEISSEMYDKILDNVVGTSRQLYAMTLNALDNAVLKIKEALTDAGMISNTYIIFASDNGGCYLGGGKSGPLRGTKYTLLEGGTKVDAFIYSYMLDESLRGTTFDNLFHVSDWFPTILELADITYTPEAGYSLDGVSQVSSWSTGDVVRTTMLYNTYTNIEQYYTDMWQNGTFAVRNEQYKLIHFFNGSYAQWHEYYVEQDDDDNLNTVSSDCTFKGSYKDGNFTYALYDLTNDPYETNNLYDMDDDLDIVAAKTELYALIDRYNTLAKIDSYETATPCSMTCYPVFFSADDYIVPWISGEMTLGDFNTSKSYPSYCGIWNDTAITPTTVWG